MINYLVNQKSLIVNHKSLNSISLEYCYQIIPDIPFLLVMPEILPIYFYGFIEAPERS